MNAVTSRSSQQFTLMCSPKEFRHTLLLFVSAALFGGDAWAADRVAPSVGTHVAAAAGKQVPASTSSVPSRQVPAALKNEASKQRPVSATSKPLNKQSNSAPQTHVTPAAANHSPRAGFIPPPPPVTPIGGQFIFVPSSGPMFLSEPDIKKRRATMAVELKKAQDTAAQQDKRLAEKKERWAQFDSLYKDGIISRREFESAQDEATQTQTEVDAAHMRVSDLKREIDAIDGQLKASEPPKRTVSQKTSAVKKAKKTPEKVVKPGKN